MANIFVDDGGSNTAPHETWAKAATTFLVGVDAAAAGDDIIIGADHAETVSSNTTYAFPGVIGNPSRVISSTVGAGSTIVYNKADNIQLDSGANVVNFLVNGVVLLYGVSWNIGHDLRFVSQDSAISFDDSVLELTQAAARIDIEGGNSDQEIHLKNTDLNFSAAAGTNARHIRVRQGGTFDWHGGTLSWTNTQPVALFDSPTRGTDVRLSGLDLSALSTAIMDATSADFQSLRMHHCLLNSSVSLMIGSIVKGNSSLLMSGCDDTTGNDLYRLEYIDYWGSTVHDDAIFLSSSSLQSSDGTTPISWKIVSTASAAEFSEPTKSPPIYAWVDATGSTTFTVEIVWDSATNAQDDEIWLEIEFLEASADTDSAFTDDRMADITATPADQGDSSETWTGTSGFTNENTQKLVVTATVNRVGPVIGRVHVGKPSATFYANAKMNVAAA